MEQMTEAICKEIELRKNELPENELSSVYFGGGTPSLMLQKQLTKIFNTIEQNFTFSGETEITLEANPDDINSNMLSWLKNTPINRFSLGVQSFYDDDLTWMNRAHHAIEAENSIKLIQEHGFDKITIDLIYGGPTLSSKRWIKNLEKVVELGLQHVSAYCLTVEPETALYHQIYAGKTAVPLEEQAEEQFNLLVDFMESHSFEQYEISNFARDKEYALHNTSYWANQPYLGVGPSAHSFNGSTRSWNVANNHQYMQQIKIGKLPLSFEHLTQTNKINEYLMTGLRTMWGCQWDYIKQQYGEVITKQIEERISPFLASGEIETSDSSFKLSKKARIFADGIASKLFFSP
jgi:oxygen-independent coproporphyrinogen III oxidase